MHDYMAKYLRPAEESDVAYIAEHIRDQDRDEIFAKCGPYRTVYGIIRSSLLVTPDPVIAVSPKTGEPIAVLGVAQPTLLGRGVGRPWMLGTTGVATAPRGFLQGGRAYVQSKLKQYPNGLENYVDVRNTVSIRWLKALGFEMHAPEPYGEQKRLFRRFSLGTHTDIAEKLT